MKNKQLNNIINEIINIVKNNNKNNAIKRISNLINPINNKKIGKDYAEKLYLENCVHAIKYDKFKHKNNINSYVDNVNSKLK